MHFTVDKGSEISVHHQITTKFILFEEKKNLGTLFTDASIVKDGLKWLVRIKTSSREKCCLD